MAIFNWKKNNKRKTQLIIAKLSCINTYKWQKARNIQDFERGKMINFIGKFKSVEYKTYYVCKWKHSTWWIYQSSL